MRSEKHVQDGKRRGNEKTSFFGARLLSVILTGSMTQIVLWKI